MPLTGKVHWFKIVCCQVHNEVSTAAVVMDDMDHEGLSNVVKALAWPRHEDAYVVKQFIPVKAINESS